MGWLETWIGASIRHRVLVILAGLLLVVAGLVAFGAMIFDALPDLTGTQVNVVTSAPGLASTEVELLVTVPVERSLAGLPGLEELRSLSRNGISSVTAVFVEGTDLPAARLLVQGRLDAARADIPAGLPLPELGPMTTGLGEVVQFTVRSDAHSPRDLTRLFQRDIRPVLQAVRGVVEVNAWGLAPPRMEVQVDPWALALAGWTTGDFAAAVEAVLGRVAGGMQVGASDTEVVQGLMQPSTEEALEALWLRGPGGDLALRDVARVVPATEPVNGLATAAGDGECLFVMVQLLAGADALRTVDGILAALNDVQASLPEGVVLEVVYRRDRLVRAALATVARSLSEGALLVLLILLVMLGDLRAGLLVATVIPMSLLGAFIGMYALGFSGNLLSLGAIDFGMIVDGSVVLVEAVVASTGLRGTGPADRIRRRAASVAGPVLFAVGVLMLVYVPVVMMRGTEGRLFRPMAVTVLLALATALVLTFTWVPALASLMLRNHGDHETWAVRGLRRLHEPVLQGFLRRPWLAVALTLVLLGGGVVAALRLPVAFVPRLDEGDLVVQTVRLPGVPPEVAIAEATRVEQVIRRFPEVLAVGSRVGAPAMATDPMGMEEADVLIHLHPQARWRPGLTTGALVEAMEAALQADAPGAELKFTQPIEMRFNEMLQGIRTDVGVLIYGPDLDVLLDLGRQVGMVLEGLEGAADVVPPALEGQTVRVVTPDTEAMRGTGLTPRDVLGQVGMLQLGQEVGRVAVGHFLEPVVVRLDLPRSLALEDMPVPLPRGGALALGEVAAVERHAVAATVLRAGGMRRVIVEANVRGRPLSAFVAEAEAAVRTQVPLPPGYRIVWGGQMEQMREASRRTALMLPLLLMAIVALLLMALGSFRVVLLILLNVPVAITGGLWTLVAVGLPLSMPAIVGCMALTGIATMNGVVLLSRTGALHRELGARDAALASARERLRPVFTTALVAGIGFVPMALAHGVGAEIQRPLALVVIGGLVTSLLLTLVLLPSLYAIVMPRYATGAGPGSGAPPEEPGTPPSDPLPPAFPPTPAPPTP
jgi:cobalt-zinc-cadmium resistance protein CzcA